MTYRRLTSPGRSRRAERSRTSAPSIGRVRRGRLGWRALERGVVAEHQDDDDADDGAEGKEDQPGLVGAAPVAQQAEDLRAEIAAEIANRIDGGDAGRRGGAAEQRRRQGPEHRQDGEEAETRNAQKEHLERRRRRHRGEAEAEDDERQRDDDMEFTLAGAVGMAAPQQHADRPDDIRQRGNESGGENAQPAQTLDDARQEEDEPGL